MKAKILKTEEEYEAALAYVETLMDAENGSPEEEDLELFSVLIEQYEQEHYPIEPADPIDAILFRMEQQGMLRKELAPYIGSQSKVSEVLNRKRPLSLPMIRRLHEGLGIPADVLLQEPGKELEPPQFDYRNYPLNEMRNCGYFEGWQGSVYQTQEHAEELLTDLFSVFQGEIPQPVFCRRSENQLDVHALTAWHARALTLIQSEVLPPYVQGALDGRFFKKLVRASYFPNGPQLVKGLLNECGVHFVLLPHLSRTYLDGASFLTPAGRPVIGMTLRHDRLDNFWFTLLHELAHVHLHLHNYALAFFDDVEQVAHATEDEREVEANAFAQEQLIPQEVWEMHKASLLTASDSRSIKSLADCLEISPSIIAGRIRWMMGNYSRHSELVGRGKVRTLFPDFMCRE